MADETIQGGNINTAFQGIKKDELPDGSFAFVFSQSKGSKTFTPKAPTGAALILIAANENRKTALIVNEGAVKVWVGKDNTVTTANGIPLLPNGVGYIEDRDSTDAWWGITAGGTADLRVMEVA